MFLLFLLTHPLYIQIILYIKNFHIVPTEVKELYQKVNTEGFQKARKRHQLLVGYCFAAVNLYAVVSVKKVVEIFNEQNTAKTHIEELLLALEKIAERSDLVVLDPEKMELYNNLYSPFGRVPSPL